jgi:hypothetical protein
MCQTDTGMVVHVCNPSKKKNAKIFSEWFNSSTSSPTLVMKLYW